MANLVGIASAAYFVSISGRLAGVIPALLILLVLDVRMLRQLLREPAATTLARADEH